MRRIIGGLLLALTLAAPAGALAWDGVTHGRITDLAVEKTTDPELAAFLRAHRGALHSGEAFPDWGHGLKPHGNRLHQDYLDAAWADLQDPVVKAQPNYDHLVAHYLGAYAHVIEDRVLDATLKKHAEVVGEAGRDDMENAVLGAVNFLDQRHTPYVPKADLARIYERHGYFDETRLNADNLFEVMDATMAESRVINRQIKLLSFLGAGYMRRKFPWGAANLEDAPGGYHSNAEAVAKGWAAIWAEMHGRPAPFFVFTLPADNGTLPGAEAGEAYGRITVTTSRRFDVRGLSPDMVRLTGPDGAVPVRIWPYIDIPGHDVDVAFQIEALEPWRPGAAYRLSIEPGPEAPADLAGAPPLHIGFRVPAGETFTERLSAPRPWAMGLFLFAMVGGAAGMMFGLPQAAWAALGRRTQPRGLALASGLFRLAGVALAGAALWLLLTDGAAFIEFLRRHH